MDIDEVYNNLCIYDSRHPDYGQHGYDDPGAEDPQPARIDCFCDKCFYGKDQLAVYILELLAQNQRLKDAIRPKANPNANHPTQKD